MTTNQPTNTLPDANTAPTDPPTGETAQERRKRLSAEKKALEKEKMRAELRAELEAEMRAELAKKDAEIADLKKKPVRKAREPKPPTYWEGQVETEDGNWRFETAETAKLYGKSLRGDERDDFMMNWGQSFAEKKEKKSGRGEGKDARTLKATESKNRCSANVWNGGNGCRCRFDGNFDAIDFEGKAVKVCKTHKNSIDNAMMKYIDWKPEMGYICGWHDQPDWKEQHDTNKNKIRPDFKKKPRGKKD